MKETGQDTLCQQGNTNGYQLWNQHKSKRIHVPAYCYKHTSNDSYCTVFRVQGCSQTKNERGGGGGGEGCTLPYSPANSPSILSANLPTMLTILSQLLFYIIPEQCSAVHVCTPCTDSHRLSKGCVLCVCVCVCVHACVCVCVCVCTRMCVFTCRSLCVYQLRRGHFETWHCRFWKGWSNLEEGATPRRVALVTIIR